MEPVLLRPEREYVKLMFVIWSIVLTAVLAGTLSLIIFIPDTAGQIVFGIITIVFLIVMIFEALWIPAFFKTLEYEIDSEAVKMNKGVFWKKRTTVPYQKITNVDISQGPLERRYDIGTIHVQTAGAGGAQGARAELTLSGVRNIEQFKSGELDCAEAVQMGNLFASRYIKAPLDDRYGGIYPYEKMLTAIREN